MHRIGTVPSMTLLKTVEPRLVNELNFPDTTVVVDDHCSSKHRPGELTQMLPMLIAPKGPATHSQAAAGCLIPESCTHVTHAAPKGWAHGPRP